MRDSTEYDARAWMLSPSPKRRGERALFRQKLRDDGRLPDLPRARFVHANSHLDAAQARGSEASDGVRVGGSGFIFAGIVGKDRTAIVGAVCSFVSGAIVILIIAVVLIGERPS